MEKLVDYIYNVYFRLMLKCFQQWIYQNKLVFTAKATTNRIPISDQ